MTNIVQIKKLLKEADAVLIGAGAGLSEAAGIHYSGEKFNKDFIDYIRKYGFEDLYTSSFYSFNTEEEKWAYWAKHIYYAYYEKTKNDLYSNLYEIIKNKNYFVITTNTDGKFIQNGFDREKVFEVQGRYSDLQCSIPCHNKLYNNEKFVKEAIEKTNENLKIPRDLIPKCPVCNKSI